MKMKKNIFIILFFLYFRLYAENAVKADPDFTFTGYEYAGVSIMKIGDCLDLRLLQTGGFIEVRDEKRFNRRFTPTHNWRGYFFLYSRIFTRDIEQKMVFFNIGYEHESAHATMGIQENTTDAYEKIYDGQYRKIDLNSLLIRYNRIIFFGRNFLSTKFDYQFYFISKNTPELTGKALSVGNGLSLGLEFTRDITDLISAYISVFDRYIFKGKKKASGDIYCGSGDDFKTIEKSYPIINEINSVSAKTGISLDLSKINRKIDVYFSILYGNIFGFVDSRDKRLRFSGGLCIWR